MRPASSSPIVMSKYTTGLSGDFVASAREMRGRTAAAAKLLVEVKQDDARDDERLRIGKVDASNCEDGRLLDDE